MTLQVISARVNTIRKIVACLKESRNFYKLLKVMQVPIRRHRTRLDLYEFSEENRGSRSILEAINREIAGKLNAVICQTQTIRTISLLLYKILSDKAKMDKW